MEKKNNNNMPNVMEEYNWIADATNKQHKDWYKHKTKKYTWEVRCTKCYLNNQKRRNFKWTVFFGVHLW